MEQQPCLPGAVSKRCAVQACLEVRSVSDAWAWAVDRLARRRGEECEKASAAAPTPCGAPPVPLAAARSPCFSWTTLPAGSWTWTWRSRWGWIEGKGKKKPRFSVMVRSADRAVLQACGKLDEAEQVGELLLLVCLPYPASTGCLLALRMHTCVCAHARPPRMVSKPVASTSCHGRRSCYLCHSTPQPGTISARPLIAHGRRGMIPLAHPCMPSLPTVRQSSRRRPPPPPLPHTHTHTHNEMFGWGTRTSGVGCAAALPGYLKRSRMPLDRFFAPRLAGPDMR